MNNNQLLSNFINCPDLMFENNIENLFKVIHKIRKIRHRPINNSLFASVDIHIEVNISQIRIFWNDNHFYSSDPFDFRDKPFSGEFMKRGMNFVEILLEICVDFVNWYNENSDKCKYIP